MRVDLREEIRSICDKLGHPYESVAQLDIYPTYVVANVYERNEHGSHFSRDGVVPQTSIRTSILS